MESPTNPVPPICPSQSTEEDRGSFPGGPHRRPQHLGAHSSGRRLVSRFSATRTVATLVREDEKLRAQPRASPGRGLVPQLCRLSAVGAEPAAPDAAGVAQPWPSRSRRDRASGTRALGVLPASGRWISAPPDHGSFHHGSVLWFSNSLGIGDPGAGLAGVADLAGPGQGCCPAAGGIGVWFPLRL